jgi:hypothetical protein
LVPYDIRPQGTNLEFKYLHKFETEFKKKLGYESRFHIRSIQKKIGGHLATVPLRQGFVSQRNKWF